jgi:hypothetical protein
MNILETEMAKGMELAFTEDSLVCTLEDGRIIAVPLAYYPKLLGATRQQLEDFEWLGGGIGIHWPQLDEDLSVKGFLLGSIAPGGRK